MAYMVELLSLAVNKFEASLSQFVLAELIIVSTSTIQVLLHGAVYLPQFRFKFELSNS